MAGRKIDRLSRAYAQSIKHCETCCAWYGAKGRAGRNQCHAWPWGGTECPRLRAECNNKKKA
ncbi:MAG: hypothetical protein A4E73_02448 [Syntrophaceae bacterium PtaU1.Bin231]|nr:MAG: hypothetical protein A4E73_02448 [Syntrophaceae bacterium PtaU1.Bin231]